jgi:hypothetical protein
MGKSPRHVTASPKDVDLDVEVVLDSQGRRVTEEYAEAAAADALAQVGRGRRSLTGRAAHSPRVSVRVTDATAKRLDEIAEREGKTRSQVAREALERL